MILVSWLPASFSITTEDPLTVKVKRHRSLVGPSHRMPWIPMKSIGFKGFKFLCLVRDQEKHVWKLSPTFALFNQAKALEVFICLVWQKIVKLIIQ